MKVTKDTTIGEVLEAKPELEEVLRKYMGEVGCLSCPMRAMETLENGAQVHGIKEEDLNKMVKELNEKL
ncbi:DUF1858 domain-containing protein [Patescibacteria group bacterium]|nr:DUF1858 domain-containing protein [Patescibacteria group bacterium]MBU1673369.1 DUF1858 domain-containing protein [Patescibacteria group bacterium]MBU1963411.1 DUF1858 domain-containing protein [Patescibacteria group bacterium]